MAAQTNHTTAGGDKAVHGHALWAKRRRLILGILILTVVCYFSGKFGLSLSVLNKSTSPVWPTTGIALAALILVGMELWPGVLLGAFLVNIYTQGSPLTALGIAIGNTLEAVVGAWLVCKYANGFQVFERTVTVLRYLILAVFLSTAISATIGVSCLCLGKYGRWDQFVALWCIWWLGDFVSNLVVAPMLIVWVTKPPPVIRSRSTIELICLVITVFFVTQLVFPVTIPWFHSNQPIGYMVLLPVVWAAFRFGTHGAVTAAFISSVIALTASIHGEGPFVTADPDSSVLYTQLFIGTLSATALVLSAVVSEREQARAGYARLAAIVESSDDAILTKNVDGFIASWNRGAQRVFGYAPEEIVGQPITRIIPPELHFEEERIMNHLLRGEPLEHYETIRLTKDGRRLDVSLSVSAVHDETGKFIGISKILRDISRQKKAEHALEQTLATLEDTVQKRTASLTEAISELEAFSYSLSHDMRAPLRAIQNFIQIVLTDFTGQLPEDGRRYLEKVLKSSQRLDQLVLDVLALSLASRQDLVFKPVDLEKLMQTLISEHPEFQPPRGAVKLRPPLYTVVGHEPSLVQCFTNLLSNAVKFIPVGVKPKVQVWAEIAREGFVRVWIEDNGIGIDEAVQGRLFQMFERVHSGRQYEGSGFGLAIVRKAIDRMGGKVGVESELGKGSRFWVELPVASQEGKVT